MGSIDISIEGVDKATEMYDEVAAQVESMKKTLPQQMADMIIAEARSNLQNNQSIVSADLHASIKILATDNDSITVGSDLFYANYVEFGRGIVRPIKGKFLRFKSKDTGEWIFAREVGPAAPRPFFWPAVGDTLKQIKQIVKDSLDNV